MQLIDEIVFVSHDSVGRHVTEYAIGVEYYNLPPVCNLIDDAVKIFMTFAYSLVEFTNRFWVPSETFTSEPGIQVQKAISSRSQQTTRFAKFV